MVIIDGKKLKYQVGDILNISGYSDTNCIVTAIIIRADESIDYQVESVVGTDIKVEVLAEKRLELLQEVSRLNNNIYKNNDKLENKGE